MNSLPPWAQAPFDLLLHAEEHFQKCEDFDRRIALISFDNTIEVSITVYLALNPIQRDGREYAREDVDKWLKDYHTKLDFLEKELPKRSLAWEVEKSHIVWAHNQRNEQYHGGNKGTPEMHTLKTIRKAAVWIFSFLYGVVDTELLLAQAVMPKALPQKETHFDRAIDGEYGMIVVGEQNYYSSEVLFYVDYEVYRDLGERLCGGVSDNESEKI